MTSTSLRSAFAALALLAATLASHTASAVEYTRLVTDKSALSFTYKQMNAPMEGSFKRFKGTIAFDPAQPAKGSASFDIEVASIDVGSPDGNGEIGGKQWFNAAQHPTARFVSSSIKPLGNNRFDVAGKLTIKGKTLDVSTPVTYRADGANGVFEGAFAIKRNDFAIGEGPWVDTSIVANEVQIKFRLVAAPK